MFTEEGTASSLKDFLAPIDLEAYRNGMNNLLTKSIVEKYSFSEFVFWLIQNA